MKSYSPVNLTGSPQALLVVPANKQWEAIALEQLTSHIEQAYNRVVQSFVLHNSHIKNPKAMHINIMTKSKKSIYSNKGPGAHEGGGGGGGGRGGGG